MERKESGEQMAELTPKASKVTQAPEDPPGNMGQRESLVPWERRASEERLASKGKRGIKVMWGPSVQKGRRAASDLRAQWVCLVPQALLESLVPREKWDPGGPRVSRESGE